MAKSNLVRFSLSAHRLRDFVLYGLVLTAKSTCQAFLPILIRSVTLGSDHHLGEFYQLLQKRPDLALQVKEFRLIHSKKLWESEGVVDQNKMGEQNMKELQLLNVLQLDLLFFINWHSNALLITLEQKSDLSALIRDGWVWSEVSFLLSFPI